MGLYNILHVNVVCPRCHERVAVDSDFRFGYLRLIEYQIGDMIQWHDDGSAQARRPPQGSLDGEGYAECPQCHKDFWLKIRVRHDRLEAAEVDRTRKGYIS